MALASKPVDLQTGHLTKKEIKDRTEQEEKLKGNNDLVYEVPQSLSVEEQKIYTFLINELQPSGILNNLDITILETTANAIAMMEDCKRLIGEHGLIIARPNGTFNKNPATMMYKDYNSIFITCMRELGMSPSARAKIGCINISKEKEKEDPLLKALRGGK